VWYGDRSDPAVGIAHFRLVESGSDNPKKGFITIWIDYKERDASDAGFKLVYPYPFRISCADAVWYPTQHLGDFKRTMVHIIPLSKMIETKTRRKRTMPQDEFKNLIEHAREVRARKDNEHSG
jgi:hypothetical protein